MFSLLYVDDEPGLLEIGKLFLEQAGEFTVTCVLSGKDALDQLASGHFDAVVSDYQMPGMDGIELLKAVRAAYGELPFILFTGKGREEVVIAAINNGADFYLQKGGDPQAQFAELAHKLRQAISRLQAKKALSDSEKRLADIINFLPDATFAIDTRGITIAWNRAMEEMTGVPAASVLGKGDHEYALAFYGKRRPMLIDLVFTPDAEFEQRYYTYTRHTQTTLTAETVIEKEGGRPVHLWGKASGLFDETGTLVGAIESVRDITERKQAEKALSDSERRLADIINFLPDATFAIDIKGNVIAWNRAIEALTGVAATDVLGKGNYEYSLLTYGTRQPILIDLIFEPEEKLTDRYTNIVRDGAMLSAETNLVLPNKKQIYIVAKASPLYNREGVITGAIESVRDISERVKTEVEIRAANEQLAASTEELRAQYEELAASEKKIQESEEKYRTLVEHSQDGIFIAQDGRLVFYNKGFRELLGYTKGELDNIPLELCLVPEDRAMVISRHYARLSGDQEPGVYECSFLARDGSTKKVLMDVGLATYQGKPATIGTIHDVTKERLREEELRRSEEKYRSLVENSQDVIYRTDKEGRLIMISPSGPKLLGYDSPQDLLGKSIAESFYLIPEKRDEYLAAIHRDGSVKDLEVELKHKDGSPVTVSTSSHLYYDSNGTVLGIEGVLHDVTRLKQKEKELNGSFEKIAAAEEELREQYRELEQSERELRENETRLRYMLDFYEHQDKSEQELFREAVEGAGVITASPMGYLALVNNDESEIAMYSWSETALLACSMQDRPLTYKTEKTGLWGEAIRQRKAVITNDYAAPNPQKKGYPAGHPQIIRHMNVPLIDDGHIVFVIGVANKEDDYTERDVQELRLLMQGLWQVIKQKRADEALQKERRFSDGVLDSVPGLLYLYDESGRLIRWNKNHETATGYTHEELAGMHLMDWYNGDEKTSALIRERVQKALDVGYADAEAELTIKDGRKVWYYLTAVRLEIGGRKYFTGVGIDLSARKAAEQKIVESQQQLEEIAATVPGFVYQLHVGKDGRIEFPYISVPAGEKIFGYDQTTPDFFAWFSSHVHPDDRQRFTDSVTGVFTKRTDWSFEGRFIRPDGRNIWFQGISHAFFHDGELMFSGVLIDITKRKSAEDALRESEEKYRLIAEHSPDMIYFIDTRGYIRYVNTPAAAAFASRPEEITGMHVRELFPDDSDRRITLLQGIIEHRIPVQDEMVENLPAGKIWIDVRLSPVINESGTVLGVLGISRDISDRKRVEEALRESEARYRLLVENSHDIIYTITSEGILTFVSPAWTSHLGHPIAEVVGRSFRDFVHPADIPACEKFLARVISTGTRQSGTEYRVYHADGSIRIHLSTIAPVPGGDGTIISYVGCASDITDLKQTQNAIRESNRKLHLLASITRHDVANQIMIVQGYVQLALLKSSDPATKGFLEKIKSSISTIRHQIEFTRTYQDLGIQAPAWFRIEDLVHSATPESLAVTCSCGPLEIFGDPMIGRVFFNMFDNAVRHGQTVTGINVRCAGAAGNLIITVEDDGEGIPPDEKQMIFEKGYGKNTGYGLFLAREILAITGISIAETGTFGQGARFEITVPNGAFRSGPVQPDR